MENPIIRIHNSETGEIVDREMNSEELEVYLNEQKTFASELAAKTKTNSEKAALLAKLGITAEEAALLLS